MLRKMESERDKPPSRFDDYPKNAEDVPRFELTSTQRLMLQETGKALKKLRDIAGIPDTLLSLLLAITPADRAAVLYDHSVSVRDRERLDGTLEFNTYILHRVFHDGSEILSNDGSISFICVPLATVEKRVGALYVESSDPHRPLDDAHFDAVLCMTTIFMPFFETLPEIEKLEAEQARLFWELLRRRR
jgi:hypothetical protein